jgi:hypothetical protein
MLSKPYIFQKELKTMGFSYASWGIRFPFSHMAIVLEQLKARAFRRYSGMASTMMTMMCFDGMHGATGSRADV